MTDKEKQYYNLYLTVSRSSRNKPFKVRKDFTDFEKEADYISLHKINNLFINFPQIKPYLYFKAPFDVYPDQEYFPLDYFGTQKAIKTYTIYMKQLREQSPDAPTQIDFIKQSLHYIAMFCIKNDIPISQYVTHKKGITYSWTSHFKNYEISVYSLLEFPNLEVIISNIPKDEQELFLDTMATNIHSYKTRYNNSKTAKNIVKEGINKISKIVDNYLQQKEQKR